VDGDCPLRQAHHPTPPAGPVGFWRSVAFLRVWQTGSQALIMVSAILAASLQGQNVQALDRESLRGLWLLSSGAASGRCDGQSRIWCILVRMPPSHARRVSRRLQAQVASAAKTGTNAWGDSTSETEPSHAPTRVRLRAAPGCWSSDSAATVIQCMRIHDVLLR
jgi:hypothetical protein